MKANEKTPTSVRLFEEFKPEILKLFSEMPEFGSATLTVQLHGGKVKRLIHSREVSILPKDEEEVDGLLAGTKYE